MHEVPQVPCHGCYNEGSSNAVGRIHLGGQRPKYTLPLKQYKALFKFAMAALNAQASVNVLIVDLPEALMKHLGQ